MLRGSALLLDSSVEKKRVCAELLFERYDSVLPQGQNPSGFAKVNEEPEKCCVLVLLLEHALPVSARNGVPLGVQ